MYSSFETAFAQTFPSFKTNEPLSRHTTLRVGGPARYFITATSTEQIEQAIKLSRQFEIPYFVLGWGSNLIVSDHGFPGLVIQNRAQSWRILEEEIASAASSGDTPRRFETLGEEYYTTRGLDYSDAEAPPVLVRVDSGAKIGPLMNALFREGLTGLQWFAGIPATVGGAIYMNMHGGPHFFGDLVAAALLFDGKVAREAEQSYFAFDYDYSVLHQTKETILRADLKLRRGDVARATQIAREWAARKSLQPQISAGCVFRNLNQEEQSRLQLPTSSLGYLIDHVLKLKGERRGDAIISPQHAAFIENLGNAKAAEVMALMALIQEKAKAELRLELVPEVELLGRF
jgi:UDP-N-acetylmuramate dehydrogenase